MAFCKGRQNLPGNSFIPRSSRPSVEFSFFDYFTQAYNSCCKKTDIHPCKTPLTQLFKIANIFLLRVACPLDFNERSTWNTLQTLRFLNYGISRLHYL